MTDFEKRLEKAIERGRRSGDAKARAEAEKAMSEQELRRLHRQYRLAISERIEQSVGKLPNHFPGFRFEILVSDRGWGAAVSRDNLEIERGGRRTNYFSRLEMVIRPVSEYFVLDLAAKGTVRNKEFFNHSHFERLADVDLASFNELIDLWVLEYVELYSSKS